MFIIILAAQALYKFLAMHRFFFFMCFQFFLSISDGVEQDIVAAPLPIHTIPLRKQYVPVVKNSKTVAYKTAYYGQVQVGGPEQQSFTVVFDTGSGHMILPSTACLSETCVKHRRYNRTASTSAVDIESDGALIRPGAKERDQLAISFGTGQVVGEFVREAVCLGDVAETANCVTMRVVLALEMTSDPFSLFAFDGVFGLGLSSLALSPQFSYFSQMVAQYPTMQPYFAVFLSREDGGDSELAFGGYDTRRTTSELSWAPVALEDFGYWQVRLKSVRIGDYELPDCADGSCRAILDTGTSLLGVPKLMARSMHRLLARPLSDAHGQEASEIDCRTVPGSPIHFELSNGITVSLNPEDYSRPTPFNMSIPGKNSSKLFCRSLLLPVDMQAPLGPRVFIWGEPVLRRYYTVYDMGEKRVGFSLAKQSPQDAELGSRGEESSTAQGLSSLSPKAAGAPLGNTPALEV